MSEKLTDQTKQDFAQLRALGIELGEYVNVGETRGMELMLSYALTGAAMASAQTLVSLVSLVAGLQRQVDYLTGLLEDHIAELDEIEPEPENAQEEAV